jgi:acetylornithine deacetylase/succinyl-diaminopimelate desuccinylase-like protein
MVRLTLLACGALLGAPLHAQSFDAPYQRDGLALYSRLIAFKTEVGEGQVPAMAQFLAGKFRAAGFPEADIHVLPLGETASLIVRYRGNGSGGRPVLAMAHMDVVTAKPEDWKHDPFKLTEEDGYFFGRGTLDIKVGVTCLTEAFLRLKAQGFVPTRDLILVFSGDEETTQSTAVDLAHNHRELIDAEFALNSDSGRGVLDEHDGHPLFYALQTAEKSYDSYELTIRNPGGHSSRPRADNAIYELADALEKLRSYQFPVMWTDSTREYFRVLASQTSGLLGQAMLRFAEHPEDPVAAETLSASPALVGTLRTTCVPTLLRGGHADNALPQSATVTVNCRIFPGVKPDLVQATLQQVVGAKVEITLPVPGFYSEPSPLRPDVLAAVTRVVHSLHPGIPLAPQQDSAATDGAIFRAAGIPTYGTSESFIRESDDFRHGLDEREPVQSFYDGLDFWYRLLKDIGSPAPTATG